MEDIQSDLAGQIDERMKESIFALAEQAEILFAYKVMLPCWHFYAISPSILFRKARNGNLEAMDKLLRIDTAVLCDPRISEHVYRLSLQKSKRKLEKILDAIRNGPKAKISMQKIKFTLAGMISILSQILGHRLKSPAIRQLFNAVAIDTGKDEMIDRDLPDSPEAFSKAIQRERYFWRSFLKPDKKI